MRNSIEIVDIKSIHLRKFDKVLVGSLILTCSNKILLQKHSGLDDLSSYITSYGGIVDIYETPLEALIRELKQRLGALVIESDPVYLGAITESSTKHKDLIFTYFWHDKFDTISEYFQSDLLLFESYSEIVFNPVVMNDVLWMANASLVKNLIL